MMAAKLRYWKEKDGRFWARISIPEAVRLHFDGKTELIEPLGGDRKVAVRNHAAAVARLQDRISQAGPRVQNATASRPLKPTLNTLTTEQIAVAHYEQRLAFDDELRHDWRHSIGSVDDMLVNRLREAMAGRLTDAELFEFEGTLVRPFRARGNVVASVGSDEWRQIVRALCFAEYDALSRVAERDEGDFSGRPTSPILVSAKPTETQKLPVPLVDLFNEYIRSRQAIGKHRDGAKGWESAIHHLIKFLGHSNALLISKRNLLDWRDELLTEKKSPKTISNRYLACIRALFRWAFENDRLPTNESETVRQEVPKQVRSRERGYTTSEAIRVLAACINYQPPSTMNPANSESAPIVAAKRWVPLLCAFTGARVVEMAQLRKEDLRSEGDLWIVRISPEAGSVKTGEYRDVPVHRQLVDLGFVDFVQAAPFGPLFHGAQSPDKYLAGARVTAGRLSEWLQRSELVPAGVQPSHGWRHRFKTQGRELGLSDRVIDAIQGHAGRTAGDSYGDVTLLARANAIASLPDYPITIGRNNI